MIEHYITPSKAPTSKTTPDPRPNGFDKTAKPPINDAARLLATLPLDVDGTRLRDLRKAALMSQDKFAKLIGVSSMWLLNFEKGGVPLHRCKNSTLIRIAFALQHHLRVRLTKDGWELLPEAKAKGGGG